jgi:hypothetical protein
MTTKRAGVFELEYTLFTNAQPGCDIQFGMDFTLTSTSTEKKPLSQLIFPAVAVGNNKAGVWNIDNHNRPSLVFPNAENGTIHDKPREIVGRGNDVKTTKFAVYFVIGKTVQKNGVKFGYSINTNDTTPATSLTEFVLITMPNEHRQKMLERCPYIKFA